MRTNPASPMSPVRACAPAIAAPRDPRPTAAVPARRGPAAFVWLAAIGLLAGVASGCSPGKSALARIGDSTITVDDFRAAAASAARRYFLPPDSAKGALLEDMIKRELLVQAARRSPFFVDSLVARQRELVERQVLLGALAQQMAPRIAGVSAAEVRSLHALRDSVTHCRVIFAVDESSARAARQAIATGEPFAAVADRFNMAGMLPPGGDVGLIVPGSLVAPLDEVIRASAPGSVQGPLSVPGQGWFVLQILERQRREQPPFAADSANLHGLLAQRKQNVYMARAFDALKRQYRVTTDPQGIEAIFRYYNTPAPPAEQGGRQPTPEQLATKLGCWDGGPRFRGGYTMREAFDDLDQGGGDRPNPSMLSSFDQWVQARLLTRVALVEAKRRHLDAEPDIARRVRESVNEQLLDAVYQVEVTERVTLTPDDVRAFYARNAAYFTRLVAARFQHLTFPDSAMAERAYTTLRGTKSLRDAVLTSSRGLQVREDTVSYPTSDPLWSMLEGTVKREASGAYFRPMRVAAGWRVIQLVSKNEHVPAFEELPPETRQTLAEEAAQVARDARLTAFVDSLRRVIPVTVDRRKLARIAWPAPDLQSMMRSLGG